MKHTIVIVMGILLASCSTLKAISAKVTTRPPQNQATPATTSSGATASANPTGPAASTSEQPAAPAPAMIGGGKRGKGSAVTTSKGGPDILGVRPGMACDDAVKVLTPWARDLGAQVQTEPTRVAQTVGYIRVSTNDRAAFKAKGAMSKRETILVTCVAYRGQRLVQKMDRTNQSEINVDSFIGELQKKYGSILINNGSSHAWGWDKQGQPIAMAPSCSMALNNSCVGVDAHIWAVVDQRGFQLHLTSATMNDVLMLANQEQQSQQQQNAQQRHDQAAQQNKPSL